jgi:hypothetical protein
MDDSSIEDQITIKQQFGHISNEESLKIADAIDEELQLFFIKEVLQETDTNVMPIERKGLNLFHPYLANIEGLRNIISVKPLSNNRSMEIKYKIFALFNLGKSNILLTDAITTGSEARKILKRSAFKLKSLGGFKKVCGYLALKSALDELEREFPYITFKFLKVVENREDYSEEHKKINYVYQKRMEPIDEEHKFIVAKIKPEFNLNEIKGKITEIIQNKYSDDFELRDNDLGIATKFNFTVYFNNPVEVLESFSKIRLQEGDEIEKLAIRFKYSSPDSKLRIMVLLMPHLNKETRFQYYKRFFSSTCNRNVALKYCNIHIIFKILLKGDRCALCSECIDSNVSEQLLKDLYSSISSLGLLKVS